MYRYSTYNYHAAVLKTYLFPLSRAACLINRSLRLISSLETTAFSGHNRYKRHIRERKNQNKTIRKTKIETNFKGNDDQTQFGS